jgi:hypothetical protein
VIVREPADVEEAIASDRKAAEAALEVLRQTYSNVPDINGLEVVAQVHTCTIETAWVEALQRLSLLDEFAQTLELQGVHIDQYVLPAGANAFDDEGLSAFSARSSGFRCSIWANNEPRGSGILVGPSTILTAWHVVHLSPPGQAQPPDVRYKVEFRDGRVSAAHLTAEVYPCTLAEFNDRVAPRSDAEVAQAHDLALLKLDRPLGLGAKYPSLPRPPYEYRGAAAMMLLHFPAGQATGLEFGKFRKIRGLLARWGHNIETDQGSSGGGCFDTDFKLVGIHQGGGAAGRGRLVPAKRFPQTLLNFVENDSSPEFLWSLDGAVGSPIVLAREDFFRGYHAARLAVSRIRGLWVKRADPRDESAGLGFTFEILTRLAARSPEVEVVRITLERFLEDFPNEIARRLTEAGYRTDDIAAVDGAAENHTQFEAVNADRGRRAAIAADAAAGIKNTRLWLYIDHPTVAFRDADRWAFDGFVSQALLLPNLRLVLAGFEAVQVPGEVFQSAAEGELTGRAGLLVEYLNGFRSSDIRFVLEQALQDLAISLETPQIDRMVTKATDGVEKEGTVYRPWAGRVVSDRITEMLKALQGALL